METILIVIVVLFLLGGGGWGYSRWRRRSRDHRMNVISCRLIVFAAFMGEFDLGIALTNLLLVS